MSRGFSRAGRVRALSMLAELCLLGTIQACASQSHGSAQAFDSPPSKFLGFPEHARIGLVVAEARFYTDQKAIFGKDLIEKEGIVPIALRIGLKGQGQDEESVLAAIGNMDIRLYLQDGSSCVPVPYTSVARGDTDVQAKIERLRFKDDQLTKWEGAKEGYVFFKLGDHEDYDSDTSHVVLKVRNRTHTVDLSKSLCAFSLRVRDENQSFFVGIKKDRH